MQIKPIIKVGRRKTAVARAYVSAGNGKIVVNKKEYKEYFKNDSLIREVLTPLQVTNLMGSFDISVIVRGGGISGQTGAVKLAIARALVQHNEELRSVLRTNGLLTRDPRMVERKKYGRPKARKRFQFSKR
jgi:small subunit ribosomal protein S9